ncbi:GntR family transcriptional regulator [Rhodoplanes sp. Z2-YC6860]|uniref:GntR family transcriptional regulator n=1 Tax=Rhodoplanes sp. Z2-YC6860 TaxID=674703 RepID=UPI00078DA795|nr:GntR family transcriptional regulator [Rhodoplanes sp. Z2-YC6860]AMN41140.1 GntR family transcriptional regulator [Rhodoplanes sp. Z2-YC6860]
MTKLEMIANSIVSDIERGALREGDQLPSEEKLAEQHGVSVGTVQKALERLSQSGIISRQHGRGTFVSGSRMAPADLRYVRFQDAEGRDLTSYVHVRSVRQIKQKGAWSDFLGGDAFVRVERTVGFGSRLELYSEFWLREEEFVRLHGVSHRSFEKSVRTLLDKQLSLPTLRVDQWVCFAPLTASAARVLGLEAGQPGFVMEMRGYTLRDRPLSYQRLSSGPFSERFVIVR